MIRLFCLPRFVPAIRRPRLFGFLAGQRLLLFAGLSVIVWVASLASGLALAEAGDATGPSTGSHCGPYDRPFPLEYAQLNSEFAERGQRGVIGPVSQNSKGSRANSGDKGRIVSLPSARTEGEAEASALSSSSGEESEVLLALPKGADGSISDDFELGPGARIVGSYFSPVICSTVALVKGPSGADARALVAKVPDGATVAQNDIYFSSASEVFGAGPGSDASDDPYRSLQYGLAVTGVRYARDLGDGGGVRVALLDSAVEAEHQDLAQVRIEPIPESSPETRQTGVHGTLMAGVISAAEDNDFGIAGIAPGANLLSIPICRPDAGAGGRCSIYHMLRGLDLAWDAEAQIINLSLSGPPNALLERGVQRLDELGVVVVAAAGNEGVEQPHYPAAYPSVVGVGAIDRDGKTFDQSNRGSWVELSAPGVEVLSTVPGNAFAFGSGTSLAAAHVTGVLAVLTGLTRDPLAAKTELFRAAHSTARSPEANLARPPILPPICQVTERLGHPCPLPGGE